MACSSSYIKYNGKTSKNVLDVSLILCHTDYQNDVVSLNREIKKGEMSYLRSRVNHYGVLYSEQPVYKISFIKENQTSFTIEDKRKINNWLTLSRFPIKLELFSNSWDSSIYWNCVVSEISYGRYNGTQIVTVSFTCDSAFAYKDYKNTFKTNSFTINCDSDLEDSTYIYPIVKIKADKDGTIIVKNESDSNRYFKINVYKDLEITLDCRNCILKDSKGILNLTDYFWEDDDVKLYWLRFRSGNNKITISSAEGVSCNFEVSMSNLMKVGVPDEFTV